MLKISNRLLKKIFSYSMLLATCLLNTTVLYGLKLQSGIALVEESDDRLSPAIAFTGRKDNIFGSANIWGRSFGRVTERHYLVTAGKFYQAENLDWLEIGFGLTLLYETTEITNAKNLNGSTNFVPGLTSVISIHRETGFDFMGQSEFFFNWTTTLVPAAAQVIFFVYGRKQFLTAGIAYKI